MAKTLHPNPQSHHILPPRTLGQKVCIGMGIIFSILGIGGIVIPGLAGMHLSFLHNIIHLVSGVLALWSGYSDDIKRAYNYSIGFGFFYGILGLGGFFLGEPGFPGVGHMEADNHLLRILPNALEFGSVDHVIHIIISGVFLVSAYIWKKDTDAKSRITISIQSRQDDPDNSVSNLKDAPLGRSDVQRKSDIQRRDEFESRL